MKKIYIYMNAELNTVLSILSTKEVGFSMYKHSKFNDKRIYHSLYLLFTFLKFCLRDIIPINHIRNTKRHHKNIKTSLVFFICSPNIGRLETLCGTTFPQPSRGTRDPRSPKYFFEDRVSYQDRF